jgi:hypothetical protein
MAMKPLEYPVPAAADAETGLAKSNPPAGR